MSRELVFVVLAYLLLSKGRRGGARWPSAPVPMTPVDPGADNLGTYPLPPNPLDPANAAPAPAPDGGTQTPHWPQHMTPAG